MPEFPELDRDHEIAIMHDLLERLTQLDIDNPWFGQTVEPTPEKGSGAEPPASRRRHPRETDLSNQIDLEYTPHPLTPEAASERTKKGWDTRGRGRKDETRVGISSARPGKSNAIVFHQMHEFAMRLQKIPTVREAQVQPGVGIYGGQPEPTWVVSYRGNGEALRLLAEMGRRHDQDSVLILRGAGRSTEPPSPIAEFTFDTPISGRQQAALTRAMAEHGLSGGTWFKRNGKTVFQSAAVREFGDDPDAHRAGTEDVSRYLTERGYTHQKKNGAVHAQVLVKGEGPHSYDAVLRRTRGVM